MKELSSTWYSINESKALKIVSKMSVSDVHPSLQRLLKNHMTNEGTITTEHELLERCLTIRIEEDYFHLQVYKPVLVEGNVYISNEVIAEATNLDLLTCMKDIQQDSLQWSSSPLYHEH